MLRIGDFSKLAQVTVRTLRHYEQLGLLDAAHVDQFTGYRYYELDQLPRLHRILALKELGFSLEQIVDLLESDLSPELMQGMLIAKQAELEREMQEAAERLERVAARLKLIAQLDDLDEYEIVLKSLPSLSIVGLRSVVPEMQMVGRYCDTHFGEIEAWLRHHSVERGLTMNLYYNEEYSETDIEMESVVLLGAVPKNIPAKTETGIEVRELAGAEEAASLVQPMSFATMPHHAMNLLKWLTLNGYTPTGPLREVHLFGHPKTVDAGTEVIMELQIPVSRNPIIS